MGGSRLILHWIGVLASALPCLAITWALFDVWRDPLAWDDGAWVRYGVGLMVLEFLLLHATVFLGMLILGARSRLRRILLVAGLLALYGLVAGALAAGVDSYRLLGVFAAVMLGRLVTIFSASAEGVAALLSRSVAGFCYYLPVVLASVLLPVPEWGITSAVLAEAYPDRGSGIWQQDPERAIAAAAFYFLLLGLTELFVLGPRHARWQEAA